MVSKRQFAVMMAIAVILFVTGIILRHYRVTGSNIFTYSGLLTAVLLVFQYLILPGQTIKVFYNKNAAERLRARLMGGGGLLLLSIAIIWFFWLLDSHFPIYTVTFISVAISSFGLIQPAISNATLLAKPDGLYIICRGEDTFIDWQHIRDIKFFPGILYLPGQRPNMHIIMKDGSIYKLVLVRSQWYSIVAKTDTLIQQLGQLAEISKVSLQLEDR